MSQADTVVQRRLLNYVAQFAQTAIINRAMHLSLTPGDLDDWPIDMVTAALEWSARNMPKT